MIFTREFDREISKIERREGVAIAGVIAFSAAPDLRRAWGISWRENCPEHFDATFRRSIARNLPAWDLVKILLRKAAGNPP